MNESRRQVAGVAQKHLVVQCLQFVLVLRAKFVDVIRDKSYDKFGKRKHNQIWGKVFI